MGTTRRSSKTPRPCLWLVARCRRAPWRTKSSTPPIKTKHLQTALATWTRMGSMVLERAPRLALPWYIHKYTHTQTYTHIHFHCRGTRARAHTHPLTLPWCVTVQLYVYVCVCMCVYVCACVCLYRVRACICVQPKHQTLNPKLCTSPSSDAQIDKCIPLLALFSFSPSPSLPVSLSLPLSFSFPLPLTLVTL